jgi:hypothetical protein
MRKCWWKGKVNMEVKMKGRSWLLSSNWWKLSTGSACTTSRRIYLVLDKLDFSCWMRFAGFSALLHGILYINPRVSTLLHMILHKISTLFHRSTYTGTQNSVNCCIKFSTIDDKILHTAPQCSLHCFYMSARKYSLQSSTGFLNGQCHEIFHLWFFSSTTSPGPNGHAQKLFWIFPNIRGVIRILNWLPGDEYTGESIRIPEVRQFFQT